MVHQTIETLFQREKEGDRAILYQRCHSLLESFVRLYESLLLVMRDEKEALLFSSLEDLKKSNRDKESLISQIRDLEEEKNKWAATSLKKGFFSKEKYISCFNFVSYFQGQKAMRLKNLSSVLSSLIVQVQELNSSNQSLVRSSLKHLELAMDSLREFFCDKTIYRNRGSNKKDSLSSGRLVRRRV